MVSLIACVVLAQEQKLTLTMPCTTVQQLARELSLKTGRDVGAAPNVAADPLVIRVADVTLEELTEKVATVIGGKCIKSGDSFQITRTAAQEDEQYKAYLKGNLIALKPAIDALTERSRKPYDSTAAIAATLKAHPGGDRDPGVVSEVGGGSPNSPFNSLLGRLLALVPPERIAALGPGERIVYSTSPSRVQVGLGATGQREVEWVNRTHDAFLEAIAKKPKAKGFFAWAETNEWRAPVAELLFIVQKGDYGTGLRLYGLARDGGRVFQATAGLNVPYIGEQPQPPKMPDVKLELPATVERLRVILRGTFTNERTDPAPEVTRDVQSLIVDYQNQDASVVIGSAYLLSAATKMKRNLVAMPSSEMYWLSLSYDPEKKSPSFWQVLNFTMQADLDESWLTVKPKNPFLSRMFRLDRPTMAQYFASIASNRRVRVADQALAATASVWPNSINGVMHLTTLFAPSPRESSLATWRGLRFFATLTPRLLEAMKDPQGIAVSDLTPLQRDRLAAIVYGSEDSVVLVQQQGKALVSQEPTEALPNGLPPSARISLRVRESMMAFGVHERMPFFNNGYSASAVAYQLAMAEQKGRSADMVVFERYRFGTQGSYSFNVDLGNDLRTAFRLDEVSYDVRSRPVGVDDFPEPFASEVKKEMERARKLATPISAGKPPPPQNVEV